VGWLVSGPFRCGNWKVAGGVEGEKGKGEQVQGGRQEVAALISAKVIMGIGRVARRGEKKGG